MRMRRRTYATVHLNFTVWADKAESARILRGGQADDRFGVGDQVDLVEPAN